MTEPGLIVTKDALPFIRDVARLRSPFHSELLAYLARRREWGECCWTAPDLFRPPVRLIVPVDSAILEPCRTQDARSSSL